MTSAQLHIKSSSRQDIFISGSILHIDVVTALSGVLRPRSSLRFTPSKLQRKGGELTVVQFSLDVQLEHMRLVLTC